MTSFHNFEMGFQNMNNDAYWKDPGPFGRTKLALVRHYLGGWFPILGSGWDDLTYLDTHAGRGSYDTGEEGSPIVALRTLLEHPHFRTRLSSSQFHFVFVEQDEEALNRLKADVQRIEALPNRVHVTLVSGDAFDAIRSLAKGNPGPMFAFVDPFGFKVPVDALRELMNCDRVELFVNIMWRELHMAMGHEPEDGTPMAGILNGIFGEAWRGFPADPESSMDAAARTIAERVGAKWWTYVRMLSGGTAFRYFLIHFTNHERGRDLMKECVWKIAPADGFTVSRSSNPGQAYLIRPEPNLSPLEDHIRTQLRHGPRRWKQLTEELRATLWMPKHLNEVIRRMRRTGEVEGSEYTGRFAATNDPLLCLKQR